MKTVNRRIATAIFKAIALCLAFSLFQTTSALGQLPAEKPDASAKAAPKTSFFNQAPDPRVQQRTYHFADTDEDLPYAVFVSSKVAKDKKNPLIVVLHPMGGDPNSLLRGKILDLAEEGGYILAAPMGYNSTGWFGSPVISFAGRGGRGKTAPAEPTNLAELSEKDVLNVFEMICKEFNVDERRMYLLGHSMGGAGALFLGSKYASKWAAIAALAPAAFMMEPNRANILGAMKDKVPVILIQGDADTVVPLTNTRNWAETLKELKLDHKYIEVPKGDHGTVIASGMPDVFMFFEEHVKPAIQ